jgi:hypothetical protein
MELYLFIAAILFWILYYYFEGSHDGAFALETKLMREKLGKDKFKEVENDFVKYELDWHWYDGLEKALVKIIFAVLIYFITNNILFSFQMILLAVGIRSFAHDLFVTLAMGKSLNHIGPDFLWWDRFFRKMDKIGINQYVIKFIPNLLIVLWILWSM